MAESGATSEELEELFKTFDRQHAEVQQKFQEVEKTIRDFRNEQANAAEDVADKPPGQP